MRNRIAGKSIFTGATLLMGVGTLLLLSDLVAQESIRRGLRGVSLSTPPPGLSTENSPSNTGGADPLGVDPTRGESGRPGSNTEEPGGLGGGELGGMEEPGGMEMGGMEGGSDPFMEPGGGLGGGELNSQP